MSAIYTCMCARACVCGLSQNAMLHLCMRYTLCLVTHEAQLRKTRKRQIEKCQWFCCYISSCVAVFLFFLNFFSLFSFLLPFGYIDAHVAVHMPEAIRMEIQDISMYLCVGTTHCSFLFAFQKPSKFWLIAGWLAASKVAAFPPLSSSLRFSSKSSKRKLNTNQIFAAKPFSIKIKFDSCFRWRKSVPLCPLGLNIPFGLIRFGPWICTHNCVRIYPQCKSSSASICLYGIDVDDDDDDDDVDGTQEKERACISASCICALDLVVYLCLFATEKAQYHKLTVITIWRSSMAHTLCTYTAVWYTSWQHTNILTNQIAYTCTLLVVCVRALAWT